MLPEAPALPLTRLAVLAHALSDSTRLGVLAELRQGERCVCDLMADLGIAQSRLSFHLRVLREAGLVTDRREGRWSFYRAVPGALEDLVEGVAALRPPAAALPTVGGCCD
jgi:ArsR family transcriptional regulator